MAKLLKLRRGTTSQHSSFTGAEGEVTIDTDKDTAVVHDGSTAAGRPLAREDLNNVASASITGRLSSGSIATAKIADNAITATQIAANAVGQSEIADDAVGTSQIANTAVGQAQIATNGVGEANIASNAVTSSKIAANAINASHIADGTVVAADLAADSVTSSEIAANAVGQSEIADDAVGSAQIADNAVVSAGITNNAVNMSKLSDMAQHRIIGRVASGTGDPTHLGAGDVRSMINVEDGATADQTSTEIKALLAGDNIGAAHIANDSIGNGELAADCVSGAKIQDNALNSEHYVDRSIDAVHIAANTITANEIANDAVGAAELAPDAVNSSGHIADNVLNSEHYVDRSIDAVHIATNTITANEIAANAIGNSEMADDAVGIAELSASGTANSGSFLRGDNSWAGAGLFSSYAVLMDAKSHGTQGQNLSIDDWYHRDLNSEYFDPDGIVSLADDDFTLGAGTYFIRWNSLFHRTKSVKTRLKNHTDGTVVKSSMNAYPQGTSNTSWTAANSHGMARTTFSGTKIFRIEYFADTDYSNVGGGYLGPPDGDNTEEEIYTQVEIWKEA